VAGRTQDAIAGMDSAPPGVQKCCAEGSESLPEGGSSSHRVLAGAGDADAGAPVQVVGPRRTFMPSYAQNSMGDVGTEPLGLQEGSPESGQPLPELRLRHATLPAGAGRAERPALPEVTQSLGTFVAGRATHAMRPVRPKPCRLEHGAAKFGDAPAEVGFCHQWIFARARPARADSLADIHGVGRDFVSDCAPDPVGDICPKPAIFQKDRARFREYAPELHLGSDRASVGANESWAILHVLHRLYRCGEQSPRVW
jgi:hypothetical protein